MTQNDASVLAQKTAGTKLVANAFPELSNFSKVLSDAAANAFADQLQAPVQVLNTEMRVGILKEILTPSADPGAFYWLLDGNGHETALIVIKNSFVSVLTERLLGGSIVAPLEDIKLTGLNIALSDSAIDALIPHFNEAIQKLDCGHRDCLLADKGFSQSAEAAIGGHGLSTVFESNIDIEIDSHSIESAARIFLLNGFLERVGLVRQRRTPAVTNDGSPWAANIRRNIMQTELDITIILDRIKTDIGALSRLQIGQIIPIDENMLQTLELSIKTDDGPTGIARGRLGTYKTQKAVKLTTDIDRTFLDGF